MGLAFEIILLVIAGIAYAVSGGYATDSSRRTGSIPGYKSNEKLTAAHKWLTIAAIVTWVSIFFILVGIVMAIFFLPEEAAAESALVAAEATQSSGGFGKYILYGLLFLIMLGVIAVGILSAIAANDINKAKVPDDKGAARQATIAASIAIPVFVLVLIAIIIAFTYKPKKKQNEDQFLLANFGQI